MRKYQILEPDGVRSGRDGILYCISIISGSDYKHVRVRPKPDVVMELCYKDKMPSNVKYFLEEPWGDGFGNPLDESMRYSVREVQEEENPSKSSFINTQATDSKGRAG